jgi:nodulation protein E
MSDSRLRVVVTGVGIISALGANAAACWQALCDGRSGIGPIEGADVGDLRSRNGAEVRGFDPTAHFKGSQLDLLDRFSQFGLIAAREAMADAGLKIAPESRGRAAVVLGTGMGGQNSQDVGFQVVYKEGRPRPHPFTIPRSMTSAAASQISMDMGITGPALSVSTACASSTQAIGQAFWMVRSGLVDVALAGGTEAPFSPGCLRAWDAMRVVAPDTCRPFTRDRRGMILGEGAAVIVLESLRSAQERGARVYAEVIGYGMSSDAGHITQPTVDGPAAAMQAALIDAQLSPEEIGYINAHGTGTMANDATETKAIRRVFGEHAQKLAVSSTKSMHGHALGASGALEAFATVKALQEQIVPPTANFTEADPECDLDYVPNQSRRASVRCALSNSFAFGGINASLAFSVHE